MIKDKVFKLSDANSLLLNLFRGLAAQAVLIGHALSFFGISDKLTNIQNSAVVIFFILSGVVIPYSTFNKSIQKTSYSFASYFLDRFSRIYTGFIPALFFVLGVDLFSKLLFGPVYIYSKSLNGHTFIGNLLMLQDYPDQIQSVIKRLFPLLQLPITTFGSAKPFWTVAIEWWIYLLFGWLVLGEKTAKGRRFIFLFFLGVFSIVPFFNWVDGRGDGLSVMWFMGLLVYIFLSHFSAFYSGKKLLISCAFFLVFAFVRLAYVNRFDFRPHAYDTVFAVSLTVSLYFILSYYQTKEIVLPSYLVSLIVFGAEISYMLYLVHYTLLDLLYTWRGASGWLLVWVGIVISNLAAILMYVAFDRHHKKTGAWLRSFFRLAE